ncbi:MAG: SPFH domain-containing protein [Candidatus Komeilibacteria bacterium]
MVTFTIIAMIVIAIIVKGVTIGDTTTMYQMVRLGGVPVGRPVQVSGNKQCLFALWPIYRFTRYVDQDIITSHTVFNVPANKDMTKSGKSKADDEMVFSTIDLNVYIRVPKLNPYLSRFFREGFYTVGVEVFGTEPDHKQVLTDHLQPALQASVLTTFSKHHWQRLYYRPTDFENEIRQELVKDKVVKNCGLNAPNSLVVRITKIELPPRVKESLSEKTIASQNLEAFQIKTEGEAKSTAEARRVLYAVDGENMTEARLDVLRNTEKVILGSEITQAIQGLRNK